MDTPASTATSAVVASITDLEAGRGERELRAVAQVAAWTFLTYHLIRKVWIPRGVLPDTGGDDSRADADLLLAGVVEYRTELQAHRSAQGRGTLRPDAAPPPLPDDELTARLALLWEAWEWAPAESDLRAAMEPLMYGWRSRLPHELAVGAAEGVVRVTDALLAARS